VSHRQERADGERQLVDWPTSIGIAIGGTVAAIALILVFTYLVDWIGDFWSQVAYFAAIFVVVLGLARRDRRRDEEDPERRRHGASITPSGLPGPFVFTQAVGILGVAMLVIGPLVGEPRGLIWVGGGFVLTLLGAVGLAFWLAGLRRRGSRVRSR
jgi:uncharacterized membrane protein YfcA